MTVDLSEDSENEIDEQIHARLLENVLNLDAQQHVKKPTRTEPTLEVSEFNLVKSITGGKSTVHLGELTKSLNKRASHVKLGNKVKQAESKSHTLRRPLEKPQADRIRRTIAYTKATLSLDRWEPVVTANRAAAYLSFPLNTDLNLKQDPNVNTGWRLKTKLEQEIETIDPNMGTQEIEADDDKFPLTLEEMMEKRKEFAKLRRHQSYREAKARQQNKIKSKKYRRILRREKIMQQMKEFELLQKTNPEEALKKLEEIERARAEERVSLRHKSTGKWARNQQVRAKYDKESRKLLAQQLATSKDLTQKIQTQDDSDSEMEEEKLPSLTNATNKDESNPWIKTIEPSAEVKEFVSGYRKFWEQQNKSERTDEDNATEIRSEELNKKSDDTEVQGKKNAELNKVSDNSEEQVNSDLIEQSSVKTKSHKLKRIGAKAKQKKYVESGPFGLWNVTSLDVNNDQFIDDVFDDLEYKLKSKANKRFATVLRNKLPNESGKVRKPSQKSKPDLSLPKQVKKVIIDEKLIENTTGGSTDGDSNNAKILKSIIESKPTAKTADAHKSAPAKPVNLSTELPDVLTVDDNEEESDQRGIIAEAFEDDDIVDQFTRDKREEIKKDAPEDVNLFLPGWGAWGGANIKPSRRKYKRFILKFPKEMPRRDKNRGNLIISESANKKMKPHLVSELPFPFKSVREFEASVRAPIGKTFVTETAFKRLTRPAVTTRLGKIIQPMSQDVLLKQSQKKKKRC